MNARFLDERETAQIRLIMQAHGVEDFDASVRLWGRGKAIGIYGDVGRRELACLLAIHRYLDPNDESNSRPSITSDPVSADPVGAGPLLPI